eukprot:1612502-Amphidinium_carterae.2
MHWISILAPLAYCLFQVASLELSAAKNPTTFHGTETTARSMESLVSFGADRHASLASSVEGVAKQSHT